MKTLAPLALAAFVAFASFGASAQDASGSVSSVQGNVMVSQAGGDFVTATVGTPIAEGTMLTVPQGASATVLVNGTTITVGPGSYTLGQLQALAGGAGAGTGAVASAGGASAAATTAIIVGVAALGAAATEANGDDVPPEQPVSR
jgi:hypothetical protein